MNPTRGAYSAPVDHRAGWEGAHCPSSRALPPLWAFQAFNLGPSGLAVCLPKSLYQNSPMSVGNWTLSILYSIWQLWNTIKILIKLLTVVLFCLFVYVLVCCWGHSLLTFSLSCRRNDCIWCMGLSLSPYVLNHSACWLWPVNGICVLPAFTPHFAVTQSQHMWSSGFRCCWPGCLGLTEWQNAQSCTQQHWHFYSASA